jgi:hypothetical protein
MEMERQDTRAILYIYAQDLAVPGDLVELFIPSPWIPLVYAL